MPTYEYVCRACGHKFEEFQPMTAESLTICPKCGKAELKRLMGAGAGMVFKGSGFYLTDYKKSGTSTTSSSKPASDSSKEEKPSSPPPKDPDPKP